MELSCIFFQYLILSKELPPKEGIDSHDFICFSASLLSQSEALFCPFRECTPADDLFLDLIMYVHILFDSVSPHGHDLVLALFLLTLVPLFQANETAGWFLFCGTVRTMSRWREGAEKEAGSDPGELEPWHPSSSLSVDKSVSLCLKYFSVFLCFPSALKPEARTCCEVLCVHVRAHTCSCFYCYRLCEGDL